MDVGDSHRSVPRRWPRALNLMLLIGSASAAIIAVSLVIALFWWTRSLPQASPQASREPVARIAAPVLGATAAVPHHVSAEAPPRVAVAARPPAPAPVAAQPTPPAVPAVSPDGEKNRAIGAMLSRVAEDPELQRRLGLPQQ